MRGTVVRVLDERYLEFIEALRDLGELGNLARLISDLSGAIEGPCDDAGGGIERDRGMENMRPEMIRQMHAFWMMGWIEVREITRKSKYGPKRNLSLKVCLDKIADHFEKERMRRSMTAAGALRVNKLTATA